MITEKGDSARKGNSLNIVYLQLTVLMLKDLWPTLQMEDRLYRKKYKLVTCLRQLSQRLAYIVDRFRFGILGLILSFSGVSYSDAVLSIDDKM